MMRKILGNWESGVLGLPRCNQYWSWKSVRSNVTPLRRKIVRQSWTMKTKIIYKESFNPSTYRLVIPPDQHQLTLSDINRKWLIGLGKYGEIDNLSPAVFPETPFPAEGVIYRENNRLMICLACTRGGDVPDPTIHIWFVVVTDSVSSFLSKQTMRALFPDTDPLPTMIHLRIQEPIHAPEFHLSHGNFANANVLGMNVFSQLKLSLDINWNRLTFQLISKNAEFFYHQ